VRSSGPTGYVDKQRIGSTGGSYRGYVTMMALGKTPDVWAAGVEEYGIINWLTMMQHEDPLLQHYEKSLLGDPQRTARFCRPLRHWLISGAREPLCSCSRRKRYPGAEGGGGAGRKNIGAGKTVDVHYYPTEGHGFVKRENQIDAIQRTITWFDRYLNFKNWVKN